MSQHDRLTHEIDDDRYPTDATLEAIRALAERSDAEVRHWLAAWQHATILYTQQIEESFDETSWSCPR